MRFWHAAGSRPVTINSALWLPQSLPLLRPPPRCSPPHSHVLRRSFPVHLYRHYSHHSSADTPSEAPSAPSAPSDSKPPHRPHNVSEKDKTDIKKGVAHARKVSSHRRKERALRQKRRAMQEKNTVAASENSDEIGNKEPGHNSVQEELANDSTEEVVESPVRSDNSSPESAQSDIKRSASSIEPPPIRLVTCARSRFARNTARRVINAKKRVAKYRNRAGQSIVDTATRETLPEQGAVIATPEAGKAKASRSKSSRKRRSSTTTRATATESKPKPADDLSKPMSLAEAMQGRVFEKKDSDESAAKQKASNIFTLEASDLQLTPLAVDQPPVPRLSHGLDRVLFNQGVYKLQDPYSMVYNFDPYLQKIMPVSEFDYNALAEYKTSSQDPLLARLAKENKIKYVGSTSSMTSTLGHFHYLLSAWRPLNTGMLSKTFAEKATTTFTQLNMAPNAMFLRWKDGTYAIDADKEYDGANVLMLLGKSLEKLLTMAPDDFERYRKSDPRQISETERTAPDSFHFSTQGDFLMRSQLDAHDPRLPGTGMFDLKTRAVVSVRMQADDYEEMSGYEIHDDLGLYESYEREFYDMMRSTMLKYSLQARMGRMDGIFVAYHNIKRMFGFQYLNLSELDRALHGQPDRCLGNQEFTLSIELLNKILNTATEQFPGQSLRFHFETRPSTNLPFMYVFAEPMSEEAIDTIQNSQKEKIREFERAVMGLAEKPEEDNVAECEESDVETPTSISSDDLNDEAVSLDASTSAGTTDVDSGASDTSGPESSDASFSSEPTEPQDTKPLLAMTLTIRNLVNGAYVERPESLSPDDTWSITYALNKITSPERARALYDATRARRRKVFDRANNNNNIGDDPAAKDDSSSTAAKAAGKEVVVGKKSKGRSGDRGDFYIQMLRELSAKGRRMRLEIDRESATREHVVLGERTSTARTQAVG